MTKVFVTHSPCKDGNTSAWAAYQIFPKAEFLKESHGGYTTTETLLNREDIKDLDITYIDICPPREMLIALADIAGKVQVLDHHKTAAEKCGDLPYVYIDQTKSGAGIAWEKIVLAAEPERGSSFLVELVQDADLWKWEIPDSSLYNHYLESQKFSFQAWDNIAKLLETEAGKESILAVARSYDEFRKHIIGRMVTNRKIHWIYFNKSGVKMPAINTSIFQSMIGNILCNRKGHQGGAVYYRGNGQYYFSLRSTDQGPDVSQIAQKYGGGGHRNAAGFVVNSLKQLDLDAYTVDALGYEPFDNKEITYIEMTDEEIRELFPDIELE